MKNVSIFLNILLILAVSILFIMYNRINSNLNKIQADKDSLSKSTPKIFTDPKALANAKIAYINIDSLNNNYLFIKDKTAAITARQKSLESEYARLMQEYQQSGEEYQRSAQAGIASKADLQRMAEGIQAKESQIRQKEADMQRLQESVGETQNNMLKEVSTFISQYNGGKYDFILAYSSNIGSVLYAKPDLEITTEIITGLNQAYQQKKK